MKSRDMKRILNRVFNRVQIKDVIYLACIALIAIVLSMSLTSRAIEPSKVSKVKTFEMSQHEIILGRCGAVLLATGDFKSGYCQGIAEDEPSLDVIYTRLGR